MPCVCWVGRGEQVEGVQVIRNLVWGKSEEQNAVCNAGGIEAIITGMQVMRPSIVLEGCTHLFPLLKVCDPSIACLLRSKACDTAYCTRGLHTRPRTVYNHLRPTIMTT